jgi:hypothetical protein
MASPLNKGEMCYSERNIEEEMFLIAALYGSGKRRRSIPLTEE